MDWGSVELEPEVRDWLLSLNDEQRATADFYIDLLAERGVLLDEPHSRQLSGKLRELRFHLERRRERITYFIAPGRRIILLTRFHKSQRRETAEVRRAVAAMERCIAEAHTAEDD